MGFNSKDVHVYVNSAEKEQQSRELGGGTDIRGNSTLYNEFAIVLRLSGRYSLLFPTLPTIFPSSGASAWLTEVSVDEAHLEVQDNGQCSDEVPRPARARRHPASIYWFEAHLSRQNPNAGLEVSPRTACLRLRDIKTRQGREREKQRVWTEWKISCSNPSCVTPVAGEEHCCRPVVQTISTTIIIADDRNSF